MKISSPQLKYKVFIHHLEVVRYHPERVADLLSDKRLTFHEKMIIQARLLMRKGSLDEAIEKLCKTTFPDPYIEGHRLLTIGTAHQHVGRPQESTSHLFKASKLFIEQGDDQFLALCYLNLFFNFFNQKDHRALKEIYPLLEEKQGASELVAAHFLRAKALYLALENKLPEAIKISDQAVAACIDKFKPDLTYALMTKFDLLVKGNYLPEALDLLNEYKKNKIFYSSIDYRMSLMLLENLIEDKPLYIRDQQHLSKFPLPSMQLGVLRCISSGELDEAEVVWNKLHQLSPEIYCESFKYRGDICLFSLALDKLTSSSSLKAPASPVETEGESKIETLKMLLEKSQLPLSKQKIIDLLWPQETSSCDDKFRQIMSRLRKKYGMDIHKERGGYMVRRDQNSPKKAS